MNRNRALIIAEIGNNHEGDFKTAVEMIKIAARTGVDAVKFQTICPDKLVSIKDTARIKQLSKFQFSFDQFRQLKEIADQENVTFASTPFDLEAVDFLNEIVSFFKIASGDNTFLPLIDKVCSKFKPIIISCGLSSYEQIFELRSRILAAWSGTAMKESDLALLHCVVNYPVEASQANLNCIDKMREIHKIIGYSDHVMGASACIAARVKGAVVIEKHFTLDKNYSDFRDHQLSADPKEMKFIVQQIREIEKMLGSGNKEDITSEKNNLQAVRRSIVSARDLSMGHILTFEDLSWVRPGVGLAPGSEPAIIGKKLCKAVGKGELIDLEIIQVNT